MRDGVVPAIAACLALSGCAVPGPGELPASSPAFTSTDGVVFGDEVRCQDPVEGFDRLEPVAAALGIEHHPEGPVTLRLGQSGVVARDLDGDGDIDLSFGASEGDVPIWVNDGLGGFERGPPVEPLDRLVMRHAAVDLTGDGLPELIFVGGGHVTVRENLGALRWGPAETLWSIAPDHLSAAMAFGDADGDGDLDLVLPGLSAGGPGGRAWDRAFRNDGGGWSLANRWPGEDVDKAMSVVALWTDRDGDGDQDLFVASHRAMGPTPPNFFYRNDGPRDGWSELVEDGQEIGLNGVSSPMGIDSADLNGDGVLDYCTTDTGAVRCYLSTEGGWLEGGAGLGLLPPGVASGDWSGWGLEITDLDVDGVLDVGVVAAFSDIARQEGPPQPDALYRGGPGGFDDRASLVGFDDPSGRYGLVAADLFGDGHPELITAGFDGVEIWNNPCSSGAWLDLRLVGAGGNVDAFGSRLVARAGDVTIVRELNNSRGPSQGPASFLLGFGDVPVIDSIDLRWPDGHDSHLEHVPVDRRLWLLHPDATQGVIDRIPAPAPP